jgi:sugar (pentulose or hexulose) kinase
MIPCIAVFDIGKTNKKLLLFDQRYHILKEEEVYFEETVDDDGDKAEDLAALTSWLRATWKALEADQRYDILAVNFTAYGASLVHLNENREPITPLYNYLKPYPPHLEDHFYNTYGDKLTISQQTASPPLGMLNAGLQLYWLKYGKPELFKQIKYTLHLPQYIAYLFTGNLLTEYTSIGCHTALWNFEKQDYHDWVYAEGIHKLFPPLRQHYRLLETSFRSKAIPAGLGLHDSSAALIPYLKQYRKRFLLLSTGTWGITLNPFAQEPLTKSELQQDCLQYITYRGNPVKASRKFIGNVHEEHIGHLAAYFGKPVDYYRTVYFDETLTKAFVPSDIKNEQNLEQALVKEKTASTLPIDIDLSLYSTYEEAYHRLMEKIIQQQLESLLLAAEGEIDNFKVLVVDGGFSRNQVFMSLLKRFFPDLRVKAGKAAQGTALGTALALNIWPY